MSFSNGCLCTPQATAMATNAMQVFVCTGCAAVRCVKCRKGSCDTGCSGKLIRSDAMSTGALACGRGCVGGRQHSAAVCPRLRPRGEINVLGFIAVCSKGSLKVIQTNLNKMAVVAVTLQATAGDIFVVTALLGPCIPGTRVRTFPRVPPGSTVVRAQLVVATGTCGPVLVPLATFAGVSASMWKSIGESKCARYRWFAAHPKRIKLDDYTVPFHVVPADGACVPCPPAYKHGDYNDICCAWCQTSHDNMAVYTNACVPDAI